MDVTELQSYQNNNPCWGEPETPQLWLVTPEEFEKFPDGTVFESINGTHAVKGEDHIDDDTRFGLMAFGVRAVRTTCPEVNEDGLPCKKPYIPVDGTYIPHGGGHLFASDEMVERLSTWHYDAGQFLSGEETPAHSPQDCPGDDTCWNVRMKLDPLDDPSQSNPERRS